MKKTTAQGHIATAPDETDIQLAAGEGRLIMNIYLKGRRMPVQTMRRAMAYRKFLHGLDIAFLIIAVLIVGFFLHWLVLKTLHEKDIALAL